jgi:hypothetical protein
MVNITLTCFNYIAKNLSMKTTILLFAVLFSIIGYSQVYEVTPDGLKDKTNLENTYLVIETPDRKASDSYLNALKYINEKYKNPDEVIKGKTENEYLRFETFVGQFMKVNNSGVKLEISANYTTELRFRDGKVKYEITKLDMTADNGGRNVLFKGSIWSGYPIYSKKDELRLEETKMDLENYLNSQVNFLSNFLNGKNSEKDDW